MTEGFALIKDSNFTDGIIEYDIALDTARMYTGVMWRVQDPPPAGNYEWFYLRPQHLGHLDATQYVPVTNGIASFQLYFGEGYNAAVTYPMNEWIHLKLVVSGKQAEVYLQNMDTPALFMDLKREIQPGKVGITLEGAVDPAIAHFANFNVTDLKNPPLKGTRTPKIAPEGTIMSWQRSNSFDSKSLENKFRLTTQDKEALNWTELTSEPDTGLLNLARLLSVEAGKDAVFVRTTLVSETEQIKPLRFGFSDKVYLYCNDQLLYSGNGTFNLRDDLFRGTVGLFDTVYLPLKRGENELWLAVSEEDLGGWGVQAKLDDLKGIKLATPAKPLNLDLVGKLGSGCVASYSLDGKLSIPCVSIPDTQGKATIYEVNMHQHFPFLIFKVDEDTLVPR